MVVQYTFAHKQYTKHHHETEYNTVEQSTKSRSYITIKNINYKIKYISKIMYPFTALSAPLHFTFLHLSYQPFTSLYFAIHIYTSLSFTFYLLPFPSLVFTFLTLVLKICILLWKVPIALPGSWFQSVMELFTKEYFPMSVLSLLALFF